jgi:hypothetical protein
MHPLRLIRDTISAKQWLLQNTGDITGLRTSGRWQRAVSRHRDMTKAAASGIAAAWSPLEPALDWLLQSEQFRKHPVTITPVAGELLHNSGGR